MMRDVNGNPVGGEALARLSGRNAIGLVGRAPGAPDEPRERTFAAGISRTPRCQHVSLCFWRSDDGGQTWQPPVTMNHPGVSTHLYQDVLLRTRSGRLILPGYISMGQNSGPNDVKSPMCGKLVRGQWVSTSAHFFDPHFGAVYVLYSDDEGRSWQRNKDGELMILQDWACTFNYVVEPSVTETAPGRLLMMMRTGLGRLLQAWSNDDGETWMRPQPTPLAATMTPAQIRTLPTGHLLCV